MSDNIRITKAHLESMAKMNKNAEYTIEEKERLTFDKQFPCIEICFTTSLRETLNHHLQHIL